MVTFDEGDQVFLCVPKQLQSLSTGKVPKLLPRYYGPFTILKHIGRVAYKFALPEGSQVHPVFHVSHLRKQLYNEDNVVDEGILVELTKPPNQPHEHEKILHHHKLRTCNHINC